MQILIVHSYGLEGSGSSIYARDLAHSLLAGGHQVTVLGHRHAGDERSMAELRRAGGFFFALPTEALAVTYPRAEFPDAPIISTLSGGTVERKVELVRDQIHKYMSTFVTDMVICNHFLIGAAAATRAAKPFGVPVAVVSHGTDIEYAVRRSPVLLYMARKTFDAAQARIALNNVARNRIASSLGADAGRLTVIPPAIAESHFQTSWSAPRSQSVALVGRMLLDKGTHLLLASLGDVLDKLPDLRVKLIGDGPDRPLFEELVDALDGDDELKIYRTLGKMASDVQRARKVSPLVRMFSGEHGARRRQVLRGRIKKAVHFMGYMPSASVARELRDSRLLLLPSMEPECFPLSLLEGMAAGCAVAATPVGGAADVLDWAQKNGPAGRCIRLDCASPVTSIADAICQTVPTWNVEDARDMYDAVTEHHRWNAVSRRILRAGTDGQFESWRTSLQPVADNRSNRRVAVF